MAISPLLLAAALYFLVTRKSATTALTTSKAEPNVDVDGQALWARANQPTAAEWSTDFAGAGASPALAQALGRWAGIESSGKATSKSVLDERGLLQVGAAHHKEGAVTDGEWAALIAPDTTRSEHARIAVKYFFWLWNRAVKHIKNPVTEPIDQVWYAKLYHQYPKDLVDYKVHGPARPMALDLLDKLKAKPKQLHRVFAADVVAFNDPRAVGS